MKKIPRKTDTAPQNLRDKIVQAVLAQAPFEGWTEAAYSAALKECGLPRAEADKIMPRGLSDVVEHFGGMLDATLQKNIAAEHGFAHRRVRDKITFAVRARIESLAPHKEAVRRLMLWYALPHHIPVGVRRIYRTVDLMWDAAGDNSADYNFYTKRILLAGVFKTTLIYWLGDESGNNEATWEFLGRRIADVMKLGKSLSLLKEYKPAEIFDMIRDKVRKAM